MSAGVRSVRIRFTGTKMQLNHGRTGWTDGRIGGRAGDWVAMYLHQQSCRWFWRAGSLWLLAAVAVGCGEDGGGDTPGCDPPCTNGDLCREGTCISKRDALWECRPACEGDTVCSGGVCVPGGGDERQHPSGGSSWTVLVYMVADNNLESAGIGDLLEMTQVGSSPDLNIIVQVDRALGYTDAGVGGLQGWATTKRLRVEYGFLHEIADLGELNSGSASTLEEFIAWGAASYPADRTALVFWDHGAAWPGFGGDESTPSYDVLTLYELKQGLAAGMARAGLGQFALIGFDACLMGAFETVQAMRPFGEYLLASEELEPGHGWDYARLELLRTDPTTPPRTFARALMDGFVAQSLEANTQMRITLSLVDLYHLADLESAIAQLATAMTHKESTLGQRRYGTLEFGRGPSPETDTFMIDLGDLAANLADVDPSLTAARDAVHGALGDAVVELASGRIMGRATGVSIYFPPTERYYDEEYEFVYGVDAWRELLKAYFSAPTSPPEFLNPRHEGVLSQDGDELVLSGTLDPDCLSSVAHVRLYYGAYYPGAQEYHLLGDLPGEVAGDGVASGRWDQHMLTLGQAGQVAPAYMSASMQGGVILTAVPLIYQSPSQQDAFVLLSYVFDPETMATMEYTFYTVTEAGFGELYPEPNSVLQPLVLVASNGVVDWSNPTQVALDPLLPIELRFSPMPSDARIYLELAVSDIDSNLDFVYFEGDI